ncbi:a disintegrin and metalloproteinase with thrombospondin motifs 9 [Caerostris extrusa]|uniref:A disintegrin and metalloproteinase with thrombospondin motifs 9 n=1 Tax=Caerostris extrusa TaxID=172846 RepID=A0AAV4V242_CAEEX|nr:a disintegrin and metalloproteinase with thrombospondin motifs 9 [Caerostris extrusa]
MKSDTYWEYHDDDAKCNRFHKQGQRLHVMARMLDYNSYPWTWSECSRHFITTFLEDLVYVLLCLSASDCGVLWKIFTLGGCRTQHMPWADGTRCGPDKSCLRGECVLDPVHDKPAQDGQWGEWQSYGPCSRTCGGGVSRSIRECDSPRPTNGGRYCVENEYDTSLVKPKYSHSLTVSTPECENSECRWRTDMFQFIKRKNVFAETKFHLWMDCPLGSTDFREEQCSSFNGKTFGFPGVDANVKWVPHYTGVEPKDRCKLYCRAAGTAAYFLLKERVIDGTTCGPETYDICINGKCMAAGCDHKLNSKEVTDVCGICSGNGTSCRVIRGKSIQMQYGYNDIVIIPAGASHIEVLQYGHENTLDDNYLALMGSDQQYLLNGNFMISMFPKSIQYAGSLIDYSGSHTIYEKINATKRLEDDLYVQVLTVGSLHPPEVSYQYTISVHEKRFTDGDWKTLGHPCNSICQGEQYRKAICVDRTTGKTMNDGLCHEQERPAHEARVCNPECFLSPSETEECIGPCRTKVWKYGVWSQCSATCGVGLQYRKALCIGDGNVELPDTECKNDSKIIEQTCATETCPYWKPDK